MQKMHKYMQRCKITTQTMTNFAVIILLTTTRHTVYTVQNTTTSLSAKVSAVKTGQRLARPHSSSLKEICIVHPAPAPLKSHKALYSGQAVSSSVAQYQHISVQCHRDTWCMKTSLISLTSCMHE